MGKCYEQLKPEKRATVMLMEREGAMARPPLGRAPSTISRELARHRVTGYPDEATRVGTRAWTAPVSAPETAQVGTRYSPVGRVVYVLRAGWSPEPVAGTMQRLYPQQPELRVSPETIDNALYVRPKGARRTERLAGLRQGRRVAAATRLQ